jgi:hypothetical protein
VAHFNHAPKIEIECPAACGFAQTAGHSVYPQQQVVYTLPACLLHRNFAKNADQCTTLSAYFCIVEALKLCNKPQTTSFEAEPG